MRKVLIAAGIVFAIILMLILEANLTENDPARMKPVPDPELSAIGQNATDRSDMTTEERKQEVLDDLAKLRADTDPQLAATRAGRIQAAVNASVITWAELGTDEEGLRRYIDAANIRSAAIWKEESKKQSYFERKYHSREINSLLMR